MRLLVVLHENPVGDYDDWRGALSTLKARGSVEDFAVYPFRARAASGASAHVIAEELIAAAADLDASAVLWCHTGNLEVPPATLSRLRDLPGRPVQGYWEGDMFQWPYRAFPKAAKRLACASDVVFVPGASSFSAGLRRAGCRDIRYAPSSTDEGRFGEAFRLRRAEADFDVVMVGNRAESRVPLSPGARQRILLARLFERKLGRRFAVFGHGWKGRCAQGPIRFREQGHAYAAGRIALGNSQLHAACCFSDRLPIAMTCETILVHNWEVGFDLVFGHAPPLKFFRTAEGAWPVARRLLEADDADLQRERVRARELALRRFTYVHVLQYMADVLRHVRQSRLAGTAPPPIPNPWLSGARLPSGSRQAVFAARESRLSAAGGPPCPPGERSCRRTR